MRFREEYGRYASRDFPFSVEEMETIAAFLPEEDVKGLVCTISDAGIGNGHYPTKTAGQYIVSAARRIRSDDPSGLIRIFTMAVRYLKKGPVYTSSRDYKSWLKHDMALLMEEVRFTLYHEVGHYVFHRRVGPHSPCPICESAADQYAYQMIDRAERIMNGEEV